MSEPDGSCRCGKPLERVTADMYMCERNHHTMACVVCYAPQYMVNGKVTCRTDYCSGNQLQG